MLSSLCNPHDLPTSFPAEKLPGELNPIGGWSLLSVKGALGNPWDLDGFQLNLLGMEGVRFAWPIGQ